MKILVTGSHFTPAQAVIEELLKKKDVKITYVGRKYTREGDSSLSVESQTLPSLGVKFIPITTGRLQRSFTIHTIPSLLKIPIGFFQSFLILLKTDPDVILSFGGYVAVPIVIAGWLLSKKIIIHEQTLVSGLANQISAFFADKIAVTFENTNFPENKTILTGNPIREEIINPAKSVNDQEINTFFKNSSKLPVILITGGNQGSHIINQKVEGCLEDLTKIACVIHQAGNSEFHDCERLKEKKKTLTYPERYIIREWLDANEFGFILKRTNLVVSRAGANSLIELAYHQTPALVIPLPYAYKNEQLLNAKYFAQKGSVEILFQSELSSKSLIDKIKSMLLRLKDLKILAKNAKNVIILNAAQKLALETIILADSDTK